MDRDEWRKLKRRPRMVRWFNPAFLSKILLQVIVSGLFGQYADRRLIVAALDKSSEDELKQQWDIRNHVAPDDQGAIWIDYVADIGEGFDSTYAVATLLAAETLQVEGAPELKRGQVLFMGGDQVYPTASRDNYRRSMQDPYGLAFRDLRTEGAPHPLFFAVPGNHDWYDGLVTFLALFCRKNPLKLGSWRSHQQRSYFAARISEEWWVWGADIQLIEDVDQPQSDYFEFVAANMPENSKIILCSAVPGWLKAEDASDPGYNTLGYIATRAHNAKRNLTICAVLSGDTHHYSRYSAQGLETQFITSGGGGAFLHPTHQLKNIIQAKWLGDTRRLELKTEPGEGHPAAEKPACYPTQGKSRLLLLRNLTFPLTNWSFAVTLGVIYWLAALPIWLGEHPTVLSSSLVDVATDLLLSHFKNPLFVVISLAVVAAFCVYADGRHLITKLMLGVPHGLAQLAVIVFAAQSVLQINLQTFDWPSTETPFFLFSLILMILFGFVGAFVFGLYLMLTCLAFGLHYNEAFSALRLDRYRHFLRLRIEKDRLTVFSIGLDRCPRRKDWILNTAKDRPTAPYYVVEKELRPFLIELPIVIRT